jgi:hypothetical protein
MLMCILGVQKNSAVGLTASELISSTMNVHTLRNYVELISLEDSMERGLSLQQRAGNRGIVACGF